ncbi:sirohydrochlorin chelatase [uncultured Corynebacterium sp.]|uniref:sirohydrochlorin chelatase n=1 Tax=uncultured Corynebacterium sp. TaxID=159447 RepID=UPI0025FAB2E0|nr:CbiX/SirB N-terminal domain-containing protein [uncultured Corynebacterium sp.]
MTALILVAHGSRHAGAAPVLEDLAESVRATLPAPSAGGPEDVRVAWLEFNDPSLTAACADFAERGIRDAVIVPLLFTEAFHRTVDLPEQAAAATEATGVELEIRDGLGLGDGVRRAVLRSVLAAAKSPGDDVLVVSVGSSSEAANDAVREFAAGLDGMLPGRVRATFAIALGSDVDDAVAAAAERGRGLVLAPLFTAPGLLWDVAVQRADGRAAIAEPLGSLLCDVVTSRWGSCVGVTRCAA